MISVLNSVLPLPLAQKKLSLNWRLVCNYSTLGKYSSLKILTSWVTKQRMRCLVDCKQNNEIQLQLSDLPIFLRSALFVKWSRGSFLLTDLMRSIEDIIVEDELVYSDWQENMRKIIFETTADGAGFAIVAKFYLLEIFAWLLDVNWFCEKIKINEKMFSDCKTVHQNLKMLSQQFSQKLLIIAKAKFFDNR